MFVLSNNNNNYYYYYSYNNNIFIFCIQLIKRDEEASGMLMRARRPRAVVMCPTRELSEQVIFPIENAIIIQFEGVIITSTNLWDVLSGISSCKMY